MDKSKILDALYALYDTINRSEHDALTANGVFRAIEVIEAMPGDSGQQIEMETVDRCYLGLHCPFQTPIRRTGN